MTTQDSAGSEGRFRIRGLLGSGGTASVYDAIDTQAGGLVALKVLHPHLATVPGSRAAFLREAEAAQRVAHHGIPRLIAVSDEPDETVWAAWACAPGVTLAELVRAEGPLPPPHAVRVAELVLDALEAVHRAGLAHRDVSASNVLVHRDATGGVSDVSLIDFGLADEIGRAARAGDVLLSSKIEPEKGGPAALGEPHVVGNPAYASPEQLRGDPVGAAGDLYQVGGLLHFALVGEPPFVRARVEDTIRAHLAAVPPAVSIRVRGVPVDLDRVIVRALLKEPADRFGSAAEMRAALVHASAAPPRRAMPAVSPIEPSTDAPSPATRVLAAAAPPPVARADQTAASPVLWALLAGASVLVGALVFALVPRGAPVDASEGGLAPAASAQPTVSVSTEPAVRADVPAIETPATRTRVPDVVGLSLDESRAVLAAAGLDATGAPTSSDSSRAAGTVLATTPAPGDTVAGGSAVALTVASGFIAVPDVRGRSADEAQYTVVSAGLDIALRRVSTSAAPPGTVLDAEPAVATRVALGTRITLLIAGEAPAPGVLSPSPSATPTRTPAPEASP